MRSRLDAQRIAGLLGRALISGIFISAGLSKLRDRGATKGYMKAKGMPDRDLLVDGAMAIELGVAPLLVMGVRPRYSAMAMAAFLVPTSLVFHDFWRQEGAEKQNQAIHFMKNLAIIGGLVSLALHDLDRARVGRDLERDAALMGGRPDYLDAGDSVGEQGIGMEQIGSDRSAAGVA